MHNFRATRFAIQRQLWLQRIAKPSDVNSRGQFQTGRRRRFSESTTTESKVFPTGEMLRGNHLDNFTAYTLDARAVPLGTMNDGQWEEVIAAIDSWSQLGGGLPVDSAEKLFQRLAYEHAVLSPHRISFGRRTKALMELQKMLLDSWLDLHQNNQNSMLALSRAEKSLTTLLDRYSSEPGGFPITELVAIIEGWLKLQTQDGASNVAKLLLGRTDNGKHVVLADFAAELGPYFQQTLTQLSSANQAVAESGTDSDDVSLRLLERMHFLKNNADWDDLQIPILFDKAILEASLTKGEGSHLDDKKGMSSFESEAMQKRMVNLVEISGLGDEDAIEKLVTSLDGIDPHEDFVLSLVHFYVRVGDADKASQWSQRLDVKTMLSSTQDSSSSLLYKVLQSWSTQTDPRAPWRADEILRRILDIVRLDESEVGVDTRTFNLILHNWVHSNDPAASRKVQDWFSRMKQMDVIPDATTLKLVLEASSDGSYQATIDVVVPRVLEGWSSFSEAEQHELAENLVVEAVAKHDTKAMLGILNHLREEQFKPSESLCRSAIQAIESASSTPSDVMNFVETLEQLGGDDIDVSLYLGAIKALFKFDQQARDEITDTIIYRVLDRAKKHPDGKGAGHFLSELIAMYQSRKLYIEAENCIIKAEEVLLSEAPKKGQESPIPLDCYKRLIKLRWYSVSTALAAEATFNRLMGFYRSGYTDLRPNKDVFAGYIKARTMTTNDGDEILKILDDMCRFMEKTGDVSCKPDVDIFNSVLHAYSQDPEKSDVAGTKSLNLMDRMVSLGIQPSTRTINFVMRSVLKSGKTDTYPTVADLFGKFERYSLEPDTFSFQVLLEACGTADSKQHVDALKLCLTTFANIRGKDLVDQIHYGILTKVLRRIVPEGARADKVFGSVFLLCCEDGLLTRQVKNSFQSMMSKSAWEQVYATRLSSVDQQRQQEPAEWRRNVPTDTPRERAA